MRELEKEAVERYGISTLILMENAGRSVAEGIERIYGTAFRRVAVLCGPGNNGGDGFVAARHLWNRGYDVTVVLCGHPARMKPDAAVNFTIVSRMGIPLLQNPDPGALRRVFEQAELVVDALFGTGLKEKLEPPYPAVIRELNRAQKKVVAVDLPSGIDADTGEKRGEAVRSHLTVSLGYAKVGLLAEPGAAHAGPTYIGDISAPRKEEPKPAGTPGTGGRRRRRRGRRGGRGRRRGRAGAGGEAKGETPGQP